MTANNDETRDTTKEAAELTDALLQDLHDEADLCSNEGATDIGNLLDRAIYRINEMQRYVDKQAIDYRELSNKYDALLSAQANDAKAQEDADLIHELIDANKLEKMAKERPDECFLKGSGILKLTGAIRQLEQVIRNRDAENWRTIFHLQRKGILPEWVNETPGHVFLEDSLKCVQYSRSTKDRPLRIVEIKRRIVMDQAEIDAAIQGMQTGSGES